MQLINKYNYIRPQQLDNYIVHTDSGIYIESHINREKAVDAAYYLNTHNCKHGHPEKIIYSKVENITIL